MENMKIRTYGIKELSERVQKELFRLGCEWIGSGPNDIQKTNTYGLFLRKKEHTFHKYQPPKT